MRKITVREPGVLHRFYHLAAAFIVAAGALAGAPQLVTGNRQAAKGPTPSSIVERQRQVSALLTEHWDYTMRTNPEWASILGDKRFNDKSSDASEKAVYADIEEQKRFLKRFEAIDTSGFAEQEALNKTLMVRNIRLQLEGVRFKEWEMPVTQFTGIHIDTPQLVSVLPFDTVKDYEDYIVRLKNLPKQFDDTMDLMRKGVSDRLVPPKILLEQVAKQSATLANKKPEESPFMEPAQKFPASVAAEDKTRLQQEMLSAVREQVTPAYAKFTKFVAEEYVPHGRRDPGVWSLPDVDARYAYAVERSTTTSLTPEQIHEIGLQEVARDQAAMLKVAQKLGYADLKSFNAAVAANSSLHPKSREELLDVYRKYID